MENNKKQTAVEWLVVEAMKLFTQAMTGTLNEDTLEDDISTIITKAKAMEREQIKSAFTKGDLFAEDYFYPEKPNVDCSENYYNETFNNESKNKN
jgi:hypothetical protein